MWLSAAIESISAVDPIARDRVFGATWPAIASVRNRIAHGYFYVDREIIEGTVEQDRDELEAGLEQLAEAFHQGEETKHQDP